MEIPQPDQPGGLWLPGVSVAVLLCSEQDLSLAALLTTSLETTGAGCFIHPAGWASQASPQRLGAYAGLLYVMESSLSDPVVSVETFRRVVGSYRQARPLGLPELVRGELGPHEVGIVQLFAPSQLTSDPATRKVLQRVADRLHTREHGDLDAAAVYRPRQRLPPVTDVPVYRPSNDIADAARSRLRRQGIGTQDQAGVALRVLRSKAREMSEPRFRLARRPVPNKDLNALELALTDPAPLLDFDGAPLYRDDADRNRLQDTLNRAVGHALEALRQEPGLEGIALEHAWGGRVKAMYELHRDLGTVVALGMD